MALEQIESQRAALQELKSHRGEYDSAITKALDDGENAFGLNSRVVVLWTDLLVDPANPQWSVRASELCQACTPCSSVTLDGLQGVQVEDTRFI